MNKTINPNQDMLEEWKPYELDHYAQELVMKYRDKRDVLNESHKMRMTVAYGLERFWGEPFRLERESTDKAAYWKDVWSTLLNKLLKPCGIATELPRNVNNSTQDIEKMVKAIWDMDQEEREISLMVLTQFCDCLVWWTQRFKVKN